MKISFGVGKNAIYSGNTFKMVNGTLLLLELSGKIVVSESLTEGWKTRT